MPDNLYTQLSIMGVTAWFCTALWKLAKDGSLLFKLKQTEENVSLIMSQ
jgi:hypothetical protein